MYILITEAALDFALFSDGFDENFFPKENSRLISLSIPGGIGYCIPNESRNPYFAFIDVECINVLRNEGVLADDTCISQNR